MATTARNGWLVIARALDDLETHIASSGTANTVVCPSVSNATANASPTRYRGRYIFRPGKGGGDRQRILRPQGYVPASGELAFDPAVSVPTGANEEIDLTAKFPVEASGGRNQISYFDIINMALRDLWVPDQVLLTTVAGQYAYPLTTYAAWMYRDGPILGLLDPPIVAGYPPQSASWRMDRVDFDQGVPTLYLRQAYAGGGETFRLDVKRPAITLVDGTEAGDAFGITIEGQTVLSELSEVREVGLLHAYTTLATTGNTERDWSTLAKEQEASVLRDERIRYIPRGNPGQAAAPTSEAA